MICKHKNTIMAGDHIYCKTCEMVETEDQYIAWIEKKKAEQEYLDNELPERYL